MYSQVLNIIIQGVGAKEGKVSNVVQEPRVTDLCPRGILLMRDKCDV